MQANLGLLTLCIFISFSSFCQKKDDSKKLGKVSKLFRTSTILSVQMAYSNRDLKKMTNDSTYATINLTYLEATDTLITLPVRVRARGGNRRKTCYFSPIKMRIAKANAKGTLFKGNTELKLVLPCYQGSSSNDYIIKEFLAYKLYETVSPYHFKTRLLDLTLHEQKGKKIIEHNLKAFFIEDIEELEDRFGGNAYKRNVHPLQQDSMASTRNAFFQYMIGNTDFSTGYRHNQKSLFLNGRLITIPYDFDSSGLCNTHYAVVSQIGDSQLPIDKVTDRLYRGFKRSNATMLAIRNEFLENKSNMIAILKNHKQYFENPKEYENAKNYILSYFRIIENPVKFKSEILDRGRVK